MYMAIFFSRKGKHCWIHSPFNTLNWLFRDVYNAEGERIFMDITSSNWYAGAAEHVYTTYAEPHGVTREEFVLFAINIESGWYGSILLSDTCFPILAVYINIFCATLFLSLIAGRCFQCDVVCRQYSTGLACLRELWWELELHPSNVFNCNIKAISTSRIIPKTGSLWRSSLVWIRKDTSAP